MSKKKKVIKQPKLEIVLKLKIATMDDVLEVVGYKPGKKGGKIKKLRKGMPYWMINSKGKIENKNYVLTEATDSQDFGVYLLKEQILIPI